MTVIWTRELSCNFILWDFHGKVCSPCWNIHCSEKYFVLVSNHTFLLKFYSWVILGCFMTCLRAKQSCRSMGSGPLPIIPKLVDDMSFMFKALSNHSLFSPFLKNLNTQATNSLKQHLNDFNEKAFYPILFWREKWISFMTVGSATSIYFILRCCELITKTPHRTYWGDHL